MNKTVTADTIARTVILALSLLNIITQQFGLLPFEFAEDEIYEIVSLIAVVVTSAIAWWKNNSFSSAAIEADKKLKELKG